MKYDEYIANTGHRNEERTGWPQASRKMVVCGVVVVLRREMWARGAALSCRAPLYVDD